MTFGGGDGDPIHQRPTATLADGHRPLISTVDAPSYPRKMTTSPPTDPSANASHRMEGYLRLEECPTDPAKWAPCETCESQDYVEEQRSQRSFPCLISPASLTWP